MSRNKAVKGAYVAISFDATHIHLAGVPQLCHGRAPTLQHFEGHRVNLGTKALVNGPTKLCQGAMRPPDPVEKADQHQRSG